MLASSLAVAGVLRIARPPIAVLSTADTATGHLDVSLDSRDGVGRRIAVPGLADQLSAPYVMEETHLSP